MFYEVLVRSFKDSNGDGVGDFKSLTEKLDYLEWLGVDCLWVPPFFTSPLRDGGYDVADYTNILPECGLVDDFHEFLDAAHSRASGDHRLRHEPHLGPAPVVPGVAQQPRRPYAGDFYVWSDSDDLYEDARIIFVDTEPSNWTWDPVRQQYFWHRFYSHQPDLNFDNPKVHEAMLEAPSSGSTWASTAPPRRGPLPLRAPRDQRREPQGDPRLPQGEVRKYRRALPRPDPAREANQWPADVVDYFGDFEKGATSATCASASR